MLSTCYPDWLFPVNLDHLPAHEKPDPVVPLHRRSVVVAIVIQLLAPIMICFLVIHALVGIANLERHYWFTDGLVYSAILNSVAFLPLLHPPIRKNALTYSTIATILISLVTLAAYGHLMVSLMA